MTYTAAQVHAAYFAGTFFIDTGYDDPVLWLSGADPAEMYAGRVYGTDSFVSPAVAATTFLADWNIVATPVWAAKHYATPHSNTLTQRRIYLKCDVWVSNPVSTADGSFQRLNNVAWSLYRV